MKNAYLRVMLQSYKTTHFVNNNSGLDQNSLIKRGKVLQRNTAARSRNYCYRGKAVKYCKLWAGVCSLIYPACKALAPYYIAICGLSASTIVIHFTSLTARFSIKKTLLNIKCVFWFSLRILSATFLILRTFERDIVINVQRSPLLLTDFNQTGIYSTDFRKISDIQFHENSSCGSRVVPCGWTERQTGKTKLTVSLSNFSKAPKT
jgi:hypothetical protein